MTQTSGPVLTGCFYFNLLFTICQVFFNKKLLFLAQDGILCKKYLAT